MTRHACFMGILLLIVWIASPSLGSEPFQERPNRVLLVIGDQWMDPNGYLIGAPYPSRFKEDLSPETDLLHLATLFKSWGIPFDIVRLDQEILNLYHFLNPDDRPQYGAIVWSADQEGGIGQENFEILREAVERHGISLVALSNRIKEPVIQKLLGVRYLGYQMTADDLTVVQEHFITQGLPHHLDGEDTPRSFKYRVKAEVQGAQVIVLQGKYPQVTVREIKPGTSAIWIGGDHQRMFTYQTLRTLFQRTLTWAVGFSLYKDWTGKVIVEMDDPGGAQSAWLDHWHYGTLKEEAIRKFLVEPLKEHNALLVLNVNPGFADDGKGRIVPSWMQRFTDRFGVEQDYVSTKRGLDEGLRAGVFEIQSHGWTHMQPDLDSPPGPWWKAPVDGEKAEIGWYREFYDIRRRMEIPPALQTFHMKKSIQWIQHQFGVTPLSLIFGGGANSREYVNDSFVLAARAGFGSIEWCYGGKDLVLRESLFWNTRDVPAMAGSPPDGHDRGIAMDPEAFKVLFEQWKGFRFMGRNEYVGYTHAEVRGRAGKAVEIEILYDPHYCRFFEDHASEWILHSADWLRKAAGAEEAFVRTDGEEEKRIPFKEFILLEIPLGTGSHTLTIR